MSKDQSAAIMFGPMFLLDGQSAQRKRGGAALRGLRWLHEILVNLGQSNTTTDVSPRTHGESDDPLNLTLDRRETVAVLASVHLICCYRQCVSQMLIPVPETHGIDDSSSNRAVGFC
jgi:hypothetical protein